VSKCTFSNGCQDLEKNRDLTSLYKLKQAKNYIITGILNNAIKRKRSAAQNKT